MVSLSAVMLSLYWSGSYYNSLDSNALRARYAEEFAQSFVLTTRYLSGGESAPTVKYDLGPESACNAIRGQGIYKLSEMVEKTPLKFKPLSRKASGNPLELIGDDVLFSFAIHVNGKEYPINNLILTGCFHENAKKILDEYMRELSVDFFDYRLEVLWRPMEGTSFENILFSKSVYGSKDIPENRPLKVIRFNVVVPVNRDSSSELHERLNELDKKLSSMNNIAPASIEARQALRAFAQEEYNVGASNFSNNRAEATLIVWPKNG